MSWVEWIAAIAGAISVYLSARENIWSWPTAIVNVGLYIFIFKESGLYSDMGLQVVYLTISIYGWYAWLHGGANRGKLEVSRASGRVWLVSAVLAVTGWYIIWSITRRLHGVSIPSIDAALTTTSLVAQWMMTRKIVENWILWIIADIIYVPMYIYKHLYVTSGLYLVFLALAIMGLVQWQRTYRRNALASRA
ncbi:MAG TPA: nicotinamide riboside transporter PnuC [Gemmatimonadaceae bacterium]|jgi:nicotinamide mononucleotide transporter|nr:nicotinamide riboside transporter PnuC [Gemmatimonadaceae bacterium]